MTARRLDADRFDAARHLLLEEARSLEAARFRFHFEDGSVDDVLRELIAFQNEDGGFGNALEPDLRAPESSAIATSVAFGVLRQTGAMESEVANRALRYLLDTYDQAMGGWRIVPTTTDASPHAPWWQQAGRDHGYDEFCVNPVAEIYGYLLDLRDAVPSEMLARVCDGLVRELSKPACLEMHDLLFGVRLLETRDLPADVAEALRRKLSADVEATVVRDPNAWSTYGLRPLQVVDGPSSPFLPGLEEAVEANLDFEIGEQQADGSWVPTWSWGDLYADVWPTARREWAGVLTLQKLRLLGRFGRIDTPSA